MLSSPHYCVAGFLFLSAQSIPTLLIRVSTPSPLASAAEMSLQFNLASA